ncbi:MAG: alanine racemase [Alphaproteobacteria bacterium]|jgi:alanine racemase|nr:alanine racemase [Alphaproteobacteria bacterium]
MSVQDATLQPGKPTTLPDPAEAGGLLTIDLGAVEANWRKLASMTLPVECGAVVKGDGYGCGLEPVTTRLAKAGCHTFFVADIGEGRRVRAIAREAVIYVLNGMLPRTGPALAEANLRPVINSTTELAEWDSFVASTGWRGGAALHVDTGMNRLGLTVDEAVAIAARVKSENHGFTLLISHLACAETPEHPLNDKQIRLFRELRILYRGLPSSLANSSGIFLGGTVHCDLVRPGAALYGANPTPGKKNPMRPVVELKGRIIQVRQIKKTETVGYGAAFTAARATRVAIIAIGYADGYARAAGAAKGKPAAPVIIAGMQCPIVGRISMDLIAVDVTDLPDGSARRGELATLIGDTIGVDELGAAAGTIGYEVLTSLGRRYHRVYKGA